MRLHAAPALVLLAASGLGCQATPTHLEVDAGLPEAAQIQWLSYDLETRLAAGGLPEELVDRQTIALDRERHLLLSGRTGTIRLERLTRSGDQLASESFATSTLCDDFRTGAQLQYARFSLWPVGDGLEGSAQLRLLSSAEGVWATSLMQARLRAVPDVTPPRLAFWGNGHPMDGIRLTASEVLRAPAALEVATPGLPPTTLQSQPGAHGFGGGEEPDLALRFGAVYSIRPLGELADLAGHPVEDLPTYTTAADPGFFAQDGFEGPLHAFVQTARPSDADGAELAMLEVVQGSDVPAPAGARALLLRPWFLPLPPRTECGQQRFTARLHVPAGATQVTASMRVVLANAYDVSAVSLALAAPGHTVASVSVGPPESKIVNCGELSFYRCGDVFTWSSPLPPGTTDEVLFDLRADCHSHGLVVDDLRVQ